MYARNLTLIHGTKAPATPAEQNQNNQTGDDENFNPQDTFMQPGTFFDDIDPIWWIVGAAAVAVGIIIFTGRKKGRR